MLQLRTYPSLAKGRITVYLTLGRDEFSVYPDIPIVSKDKGVVMNGKDLTM